MNQEIKATDLRKYRIELPNLYDDMGLDPYEFRLLAHYVRRGGCFESVRTTAKHCQMNHATVIRKRESLKEKKLITTKIHQEKNTIMVEVVDKWLENFLKYSGAEVERSSGAEVERGGAVVEKKNKPIKKEHKTKESLPNGNGAPADYGRNLVKHPAMTIYRSKARLYVPIVCREDVAKIVTDKPKNVERWGEIIYEWIGRGWNKANVLGMLEVYQKGFSKKKEKDYDPDRYVRGKYADKIHH